MIQKEPSMYIPIVIYLLIATINIYNHKKIQEPINHKLTLISKPLLMPILLVFYLINTNQVSVFIVAALCFAWIGDCVIIIHHEINHHQISKNMKALLIGLASFLCGHIAYISIFTNSYLKFHPITIMLFMVYTLSGFFVYRYLLINGLLKKDTQKVSNRMRKLLKRAIALYMLVILSMSYTAFIRFINLNTFKAFITFMGSLSFLLSDTSLSLKEFGEIDLIPEKLVMLTYTLAQCLIIVGLT